MSNTINIHRVIKAEPSKVFKAFSNPKAMEFWIPPYGFLCEVHSYDFKVGGTYKMSFTNFGSGNSHSFGGEFLEIKENELIKHTDKFDDPNMTDKMTTTVSLKKVMCGTEIHVTQENIPSTIPLEFCYLGWQESLEKLIKLVEPNIPDA